MKGLYMDPTVLLELCSPEYKTFWRSCRVSPAWLPAAQAQKSQSLINYIQLYTILLLYYYHYIVIYQERPRPSAGR